MNINNHKKSYFYSHIPQKTHLGISLQKKKKKKKKKKQGYFSVVVKDFHFPLSNG